MAQNYFIKVKTKNVMYAGTDANIFIRFYGDKGVSRYYYLDPYLKNHSNRYEKGNYDEGTITLEKDYGRIYKISLWSDCSGSGSDWALEFVSVKRIPNAGEEEIVDYFYMIQGDYNSNWINKSDEIHLFAENIASMGATAAKTETITTNLAYALPGGCEMTITDQRAWMKGMSAKHTTTKENTFTVGAGIKINLFDMITWKIAASYKKNRKLTNVKQAEATWNVEKGTTFTAPVMTTAKYYQPVYTQKSDMTNVTIANKTFALPEITSISFSTVKSIDSLPETKGIQSFAYASEQQRRKTNYYLTFETGRVANAGTDADIYVTLTGMNGKDKQSYEVTGKIKGNALENGNVDTCKITSEYDLGTITSIHIKNESRVDDWYLDRVVIRKEGTNEESWFSPSADLSRKDGWIRAGKSVELDVYNLPISESEIVEDYYDKTSGETVIVEAGHEIIKTVKMSYTENTKKTDTLTITGERTVNNLFNDNSLANFTSKRVEEDETSEGVSAGKTSSLTMKLKGYDPVTKAPKKREFKEIIYKRMVSDYVRCGQAVTKVPVCVEEITVGYVEVKSPVIKPVRRTEGIFNTPVRKTKGN